MDINADFLSRGEQHVVAEGLEVDAILDDSKAAIDAGSYLLVIPQFLVTAATR
jgi:hypothetical protein